MDGVASDRNGLERLTRSGRMGVLKSATIGRVGVSIGALPVILPVILPVNFAVVDGDIINRTAASTKVDAAINPVVAFEVNGFDPSGTADGVSWSKASPKRSPTQATYRGSGGSASTPWTGVDGHLVRTATEFLSRRRHETVGTGNVSR